jgi:outer membrane receptor protein involved in Fe transport
VTAGTRYFNENAAEAGALVGSFGCQLLNPNDRPVPNPCINRESTDLNALGLSESYSGFRSRANLSWKAGDDALLYYTWSQGFRPGTFNRGFMPSSNSPLSPGTASWQAQAHRNGGWAPPFILTPDSLTNNELGWKTTWMDQRLEWDGALYQEDWDHAQIGQTDSALLGGASINGGNYRVRGLEFSAVANIAGGFSINAGAAWNHSELIKEAAFYWANGTPIDFSSLRTQDGRRIPNPAGTLGSPLAGAPAFQGNLRARYEVLLDGYRTFAQLGAMHQASSWSSTDRLSVDLQNNTVAYELPAFTTVDAAFGAGKDAWQVQMYADNLTDTRAQLYATYTLYYKAVTVNRPRTIGLRMTYRFAGG